MKAFFRFVLLGLVLLVVALVSALTAMRFAIHGREVAVPNLVGKSPMEVRKTAEEEGFRLEVERQYYSDNVPEGRILSQVPPVGTTVRRGWEIRVSESLGPQKVQIPDVVGQSERAATINIQRRGLDVSVITRVPAANVPAEVVLAQSPPANASGISAPKINLLVADQAASRAFVMPSFIGQPLGSVRIIMQQSGFNLGSVVEVPVVGTEVFPNVASAVQQPTAASIVVSQRPSPGEKILAGSPINFEVRD